MDNFADIFLKKNLKQKYFYVITIKGKIGGHKRRKNGNQKKNYINHRLRMQTLSRQFSLVGLNFSRTRHGPPPRPAGPPGLRPGPGRLGRPFVYLYFQQMLCPSGGYLPPPCCSRVSTNDLGGSIFYVDLDALGWLLGTTSS